MWVNEAAIAAAHVQIRGLPGGGVRPAHAGPENIVRVGLAPILNGDAVLVTSGAR